MKLTAAAAIRELPNQPLFHVRQSYIMSGDKVIARELIGTDRLIQNFSQHDHADLQDTCLVKLPLEPFPKIDTPVIGIHTVTNCFKAGINGIVIKAKMTTVLNQREIREFCNNKRFYIYGF